MATERIKTLTDQRNRALASARQIVDDAESEGRSRLTGEEEARYERFLADHDRYQAAIDREQAEERLQAHTAGEAGKFVGHSAAQASEDTFLDEFVQALAVGRRDSVQWSLPHSSYVQDAPPVAGQPAYRYDAAALAREMRTDYPLTTGDATTTYSSYAVPTLVQNKVEAQAYKTSAVLQAGVDTIVTAGINELYLPKVVTNPVINVDTVEGSPPANSSYAVLGRTALPCFRRDAYVVISEEDVSSSEPDMLAFIASNLAGCVGTQIAKDLAVGAGTTEPTGIFVAATTGKTSASESSFTADDVVDTYSSVSAEYRPGMRCVASQAAEALLLKLKDQDDRYLLQSGLALGAPNTLLGVPLYIDAQGPAMTTGKKVICFFSPEHYHVRWGMGGRTDYAVSTEAQFTAWNRVARIARWVGAAEGVPAAKALTLA